MRHFAASLILPALLAAAPAAAQDKPFEGPSVTVIGGIDDTQSLGRAKAGALYGGQIGYDWQSNGIVFGIEGEVSDATTKKCTPGGVVATDRFCVEASRDFYAGGRVGKVVGDSTLIYGKAGYTNGRQIFDYRDGASGAADYRVGGPVDGFRVGAGIEKRIGSNLTLKSEYRYSNYEGGYSRHQGVVGVGLRF